LTLRPSGYETWTNCLGGNSPAIAITLNWPFTRFDMPITELTWRATDDTKNWVRGILVG
jgi:hypothetical protein